MTRLAQQPSEYGRKMSEPDIYWIGESGKKYGYWIHPLDAQFRKIAGNRPGILGFPAGYSTCLKNLIKRGQGE